MCNGCALSRRRFLGTALVVVPLLAACGANVAVAPGANGVVVTVTEVRIVLARTPQLLMLDGWLLVPEAGVLVVRIGAEYRAFSNVCTHAGCGIQSVVDSRFRCQCHGSAFDLTGRPVEGPANAPLTRLGLVHDQADGVLRVARLTLTRAILSRRHCTRRDSERGSSMTRQHEAGSCWIRWPEGDQRRAGTWTMMSSVSSGRSRPIHRPSLNG